jgi:O-antigen ligase
MIGLGVTSHASPVRAMSRLSPSVIGCLWGALLAAIPFYDFFLRPNYEGSSLYQSVNHVVPAIAILSTATLLAAVGLSFAAAAVIGVDYRRQASMVVLSMTLTVLAALSGMTANAPIMPLIILTLFLAFTMAVNFGALDHWEPVFDAFASTAAVLFIIADLLALASHDLTWGRLGGHAGPNYWGMVSGSALMLCLCLRPAWLRIPVILVACLVFYLAQSRGSMIGAVAGLTAMAAVRLLHIQSRYSLLILVVASLAGLLIIGFGGNFIAHNILLVDDQYRGAASNGSGRVIIWGETLKLIAAHPLFGVGLRQSEQYLHAGTSAHNAYLAAAAEQGLIGLAAYLLLMLGAAIRALLKAIQAYTRQRIVIFGFLVFLLVIGLFEQYSYQTGNSFALIGMIAAALSWRVEPRPTASVLEPRSARRLLKQSIPS